jgi:hypothetical protein
MGNGIVSVRCDEVRLSGHILFPSRASSEQAESERTVLENVVDLDQQLQVCGMIPQMHDTKVAVRRRKAEWENHSLMAVMPSSRRSQTLNITLITPTWAILSGD